MLPVVLAGCLVPGATLQVNARGIACTNWTSGPSGTAVGCVWHTPAHSSQPQGAPWVGALNTTTGACAALPGVTEAYGNLTGVHANFARCGAQQRHPGAAAAAGAVAAATASSLSLLGFALDKGRYELVDVELAGGSGGQGSVTPATGGPWLGSAVPAWLEAAGGPVGGGGSSSSSSSSSSSVGCVLAWSYEETHSSGPGGTGAFVNVTEELSCIGDAAPFAARVLWGRASSYPNDGTTPQPPAAFGGERAVDATAGILYSQSANQSLGRFDLASAGGKALPRLSVEGGAALSCLHYDPKTRRLGGLVASAPPSPSSSSSSAAAAAFPTDWRLVSVDTTTGALTTRLRIPGFPTAASGLALYAVDASSGANRRPACAFDAGTGELALLLVATDAAARTAFANEAMFVSTVDTRAPAPPTAAARIRFPFVAAAPLGNRTWRCTEPALSYL
jgi:hypothetical protein